MSTKRPAWGVHPDEHAPTVFEQGRQAGRAEILALVIQVPSPIRDRSDGSALNAIIPRDHWFGCQWCRASWPWDSILQDFATAREAHPANGCLYVLAHQEPEKEQG